jgi:hypothetical protein
MSLTASFRGSKVRKKIIREKSKIYKNSQNAIIIKKSPNYFQKCAYWWKSVKNALFIANNVILRFFLTHDQNFQKFIKPTKKIFLVKTKKYVPNNIELQTKLQSFKDFDEPSSNFFKSLKEWLNSRKLRENWNSWKMVIL